MKYKLTMSYPRATGIVLATTLATFGSATIGAELYGTTGRIIGLLFGITAVLIAFRIHNQRQAQP